MTESAETIHFAVVGVGHIGTRHAHMISLNPNAKLVAVVDIKSPEELSIPQNIPVYPNIEEMLMHHANIDVVCIATPNGYHAQHAIQALSMGRHVVVEKPMALSTEDCRFSPPSQWIKNLIAENTLGEIYQAQIICYWNRDHRYYQKGHWHGTNDLDGGVLFTQFSHFIDLMYWLLGPITINYANASNFNHQQLTEFHDSGQVV